MEDVILKHVLINAIQYDGKANFKAVVGKIISENPEQKKKLKELMPKIKATIKEVNSWGVVKIEEKMEELGLEIEKKKTEEDRELPELPDASTGKVVMRMAPFPSGPLHIGNARMAILNDEYVKRYNGKLFLVIDDTIGSAEKIPILEAYDMIKDGLDWLGVKFHEVKFKSDRMDLFYEWAEKLIEKGAAYVCTCDVETMRNNRREGRECACRSQGVEENLGKWKEMLAGEFGEGEAVVRLKTNIQDPNPAFRDRVLLRISRREHPKVGKKYSVWPLLEFSWAVDDHLLGITHILRGKDLVMEDMMEKFIWDLMGLGHPKILHYGLLRLKGLKLSKSASRAAIDSGEYSGWDDPRTWSIQSLRKRGFKPETIRNFILGFGMSMNDITVPVDVLYTENRKIVDSEADRYFAVFDPIGIKVENAPPMSEVKENLHPGFPDRGNRAIPVNTNKILISREDFEKNRGEIARLIGLFNVKFGEEVSYHSSEVVQEMAKIQWVSEDRVDIKIVMDDGKIINAVAEPGVSKLEKGDVIQFVRFGFCRLDDKNEMKFYFAHR